MLEILRYSSEYKNQWNELINSSRNGTFLFLRDYMDYHSHRYKDYSFLIFKKGKIEAVLPGNFLDTIYISHQGLTYGGLILSTKLTLTDIIEIFNLVNDNLRTIGLSEVIYKPVPFIYHSFPTQEDIYSLFKLKAIKIGCEISSSIFQNTKIGFSESRKCGIRKSIKEGVIIRKSEDFYTFWEILLNNLNCKYNVKPVHSADEINELYFRFPENIKLYVAEVKDELLAGVVLYIMKNIIHIQYISATEKGKEIGALDFLFDKLINELFTSIPIFDFGHSTEQKGNFLNDKLLFQKEGFGGRGIVYETYKYIL